MFRLALMTVAFGIVFEINSENCVSLLLGTPSQRVEVQIDLVGSVILVQTSSIVKYSAAYPEGFQPSRSSSFRWTNESQSLFTEVLTLTDSGSTMQINELQLLESSSKNVQSGTLSLNLYNSGFLKSLHSSIDIESKSFTLFYNSTDSNSLIFGEFRLWTYTETDILFVPAWTDGNLWGVKLLGVNFDNYTTNFSSPAQIDPLSAYISGPVSEISAIFESILLNSACELSDSIKIVCPCEVSENFPDLIFYLNSTFVSIHHKMLFAETESGCELLLSQHEFDYWTLGRPLLYSYLVLFDWSYFKVGFSQMTIDKPPEVPKEKPIMTKDEFIVMLITLAGCFGFYVTVKVVYIIVGCFKRAESEEQALSEPLVIDHDALEIAKFKARKEEIMGK